MQSREVFGTILGFAPGQVPVYSSDYDSVDPAQLPNREDFTCYIDGVFTGYKWQCVEFARRWLYLNKGYVFDDIAMAYDIFSLTSYRVIATDARVPIHSFKNGAKRHPEPGCLLVWNEGGAFAITGHVAIVTDVQAGWVRVAEQNVIDQKWHEGCNYARQISATIDDDGGYWMESQFPEASILGWVIQTDNAVHAEEIIPLDAGLFRITIKEVEQNGQAQRRWLNIANPDEAAYVTAAQGHSLANEPADEYRYCCIAESAFRELKRATNELHYMFMRATDFVLKDDALLGQFCIPPVLWPRLHRSWSNRRNQMITGRLDFCMSEHGLKVYEYNADSAACYLECGKIQKKWAEHFGCHDGYCAGEHLHERLIAAWRESEADQVLHIMHDADIEESYHALFMKAAIDQAGITTKVIQGTAGLSWNDSGEVIDADGERVNWVWKTWAWETALDQMRTECSAGDILPSASGHPRLVDVLLREHVMVFEPLWTLIPSNKAILPVLWQLYPHSPYLLNSQFHRTEALQKSGYVRKPIVGRCGENISMFNANEDLLIATDGQFADRDYIYQELCPLPNIGGRNFQVCTFTTAGSFAGACVRADRSLVVASESDLPALRVMKDHDILAAL